jgi:hypothetical protein
MKQAAVQSSAAGSTRVNSSLNDSGSMVPAVNEYERNAEAGEPAVLKQRRERTRDHLSKIAGPRENWIIGTRTLFRRLEVAGGDSIDRMPSLGLHALGSAKSTNSLCLASLE